MKTTSPVLAFTLSVSLALSGCSLLFTQKAPSRPQPGSFPVCTDTSGPENADFLLAIGYSLGAIGNVTANSDSASGINKGDVALLVALAATFAVSGAFGAHWRKECEAAHEQWKSTPRFHGPTPEPSIPIGARGGACYANGTCNPGFYCHPNAHICAPGSVGLEGSSCFSDGSCTAPLQCAGGLCVKPPPVECRVDANCTAGHICHGGYCVESP